MTENKANTQNQGKIIPKKHEYPYTKSFMHDGLEYTYRGKTQAEADAKAAKSLKALKAGKDIPQYRKDRFARRGMTIDPNITVEKYAEKWDNLYIKPRVRRENADKVDKSMLPEERLRYLSMLKIYVFPVIGKLKMKDVRNEHLQTILNNAAKIRAESTVEKLFWIIHRMFTKAYTTGLIYSNPAADLEHPVSQVPKRERVAFGKEIRDAIDRISATDPYGPVVEFERNTGARNGEIEMIRVGDVNLDSRYIHVHRAAKDAKRIEGPTKNKKGDRFIPIYKNYYPKLADMCENRVPDEFLFMRYDKNGKYVKLSEDYMQRSWRRFRLKILIELGARVDENGKVIELEYDSRNRVVKPKNREMNEWEQLYFTLDFYSLRHTFRTELEEAGVSERVAAAITGHDKETSKVYTHLTEELVHQACRKVDRLRIEKKAENDDLEH